MSSARSVLITGSNRGIGLEFVKYFLQLSNPPKYIFAGCRNVDNSKLLKSLAKTNPSINVLQLDVTDPASVEKARSTVADIVEEEGLNLLINNAGCYTPVSALETSREEMSKLFEVNATGPLMMAQAFYPLLKQAAGKQINQPMSCSRAAIINISSDLASFTENTGAHVPYRASKCALNMITSCLGIELKADGILCASIHPGWVRTDMGGPNAEISTEESVRNVFAVMDKLEGEDKTGKYYNANTGEEFEGW